ncbi:hypothetical protein AL492_07010 [Elizabethkingia anophelis]|nr:hypothetical protein AL492_07010 [Elizabethkingia anophelis]
MVSGNSNLFHFPFYSLLLVQIQIYSKFNYKEPITKYELCVIGLYIILFILAYQLFINISKLHGNASIKGFHKSTNKMWESMLITMENYPGTLFSILRKIN